MKSFLQQFGFKNSRYERPNQAWLCAGPAPGTICRGPDAQGRCGSDSRKCVPVRSVRAWRGLTTKIVTGLVFGLLLLVLAGDERWTFLAPGPLTTAHALLQARCADCHSTPLVEGTQLAGLVVAVGHAATDSGRCLACHELGPHALAPHSLPPAQSARMSAHAVASGMASNTGAHALSTALFGRPASAGHELACASCHHEHSGKDHSLTKMGNTECQSCHQRQFESFADGHPAFADYPSARRTRISFDHASHLEKHFQDEQYSKFAPKLCAGCHQLDASGLTMQVKPFDATCAGCHDSQIRGEGRADAPGIAVLRVPGLDLLTLREHQRSIGGWPDQAEGRITPLMKLLLQGDRATAAAFATLGNADLLDLQDAREDELDAAEQVAWAVKELFFDLTTRGQSAWRERMRDALGRPLAEAEFAAVAGQIPPDLLMTAQAQWFPNLLTEVPAHRAGGKLAVGVPAADPVRAEQADVLSPEGWVSHGGWYRSSDDFSLRYRPTGHADSFLRAWLDLGASVRPDAPTPLAALFRSLAEPKAPGQCGKCHSVDSRADQTMAMNWFPAQVSPDEHAFTKFNHSSHFSLLDQTGCRTCHQIDPKAEYQAAFENNFSPSLFSSNFAPIKKATCASCHTSSGASDGCLTCHNYHVGKSVHSLPGWGSARD